MKKCALALAVLVSLAFSNHAAAVTVSGTVLLSVIPNKPVQGAQVIFYDVGAAGCFNGVQQWTLDNLPMNCLSAYKVDLEYSAETDRNGQFTIEKDIRPGKYLVLAYCKDCQTKEARQAWCAARVELMALSHSANLQISNPGHVY